MPRTVIQGEHSGMNLGPSACLGAPEKPHQSSQLSSCNSSTRIAAVECTGASTRRIQRVTLKQISFLEAERRIGLLRNQLAVDFKPFPGPVCRRSLQAQQREADRPGTGSQHSAQNLSFGHSIAWGSGAVIHLRVSAKASSAASSSEQKWKKVPWLECRTQR